MFSTIQICQINISILHVETNIWSSHYSRIMNIVCTICSDLINQAENIYVTKCGHIFHFHCLSQWIERSKSCPQCRCKVTNKCMFRMYPTISSENTDDDATKLQSRLDDANLQLRQQGIKVKEFEENLEKMKADMMQNEQLLKNYEKKLVTRDSTINGLKEQLEYVKIQNRETQKLKAENESLNHNIQLLNGLQKVLNATSEEVEQMLQGYTDVRTVATFATALKKALCESEMKKNQTRDRLHACKEELGLQKKQYANMNYEFQKTKDKMTLLKSKYKALMRERKKDAVEIAHISPDENMNGTISLNINSNAINTGTEATARKDNRNNKSIDSMVISIENSDSPYFNLKQSSLALSALQRSNQIALDKIKPSERVIINKNRPTSSRDGTSIFHKNVPGQIDTMEAKPSSVFGTSYDGLGGHSKLDTFPKITARPLKSSIPILTAKHKLKRPGSGSQDIGEMIKKFKDK